MRAPGAPSWVRGALLVWALGAAGAPGAPEQCPRGCSCSRLQELDLYCQLPRGNISVKGVPRSSVKIICEPEGEGFTVDELPQMVYGHNASIRLELEYCPLPPALGDAASRLGAASIEQLYVRSAPGGVALTPAHVAGLQQLQKLCVYGDLPTDPVSVPPETLRSLPALRHLTISQARVDLTPHNLTALVSLTQLELSGCRLQRIPDGLFSSLGKLERLFLSNNQLEELTPQQLSGLTSLQQLSVSSNRLTSLRGVATSLLELRVLSAFNNRFHELPSLSNLTKLEQVDILMNSAPLLVSARALAALPQLRSVNLARCSIHSLPDDLFQGSTSLKVLQLSHNSLQQLEPRLLVEQTALEELDLSHNQLEQLPPRLLETLARLRVLKLDHNHLLQLPANLLVGVSSLRNLSVSHNRLSGLGAGCLAGAPLLTHVDLSHNNLTERDPAGGDDEQQRYEEFGATFNALTSLRVLDLSYNNLSAVPPAVSSIDLERLDLTHNRIREVFNVNFWSSHAAIYLNENEIERVYLYPGVRETELPAELSSVSVARSELYLDDNTHFVCDCQLYPLVQRFHGYRALDTSEPRFIADRATCALPPPLANRTLPSLPLASLACDVTPCVSHCRCAYRPHTRTLELVCAHVPPVDQYPDTTEYGDVEMQLQLTSKPSALLVGEQIRLLNLSGLQLEELPTGLNLHNLTVLDLSNNNLSVVPRALLDPELRLRLRLGHNPLACDCWHVDDVIALTDNLWRVDDPELLTCSSGVSFIKMDAGQLCSTWRAGAVGGSLALLGLLAAVLGALLLRYSLEVRAWLYSHGLLADWWGDDDDRQYDAFVSFCHKDEEFVREHLLPTLESGPQPYKLCIHYRDWLPGEFITTQIARSVADSRRTIIVVSRHFLNSEWARAEFRTANMTAIKERKARVIAVLLEDVHSHKELDPELKAYLSTNTYLKWGDPWFWDKLKYSLRRRKGDRGVREAMAGETRKMAGLDARLTADGVIINAATLKQQHCPEHIKLDVCTIDKKKCLA